MSRAPYLPRDFDPRFFQLAPASLVARGYLRGGEPVDVRGATPGGRLQFVLPTVDLQMTFHVDSGSHESPVALDTVIIDSDAARLVMVWRAALRCDKATLKVREIETTLLHAA
jgi:hypothetical protein